MRCDNWQDNSRGLSTLTYHIYVISSSDWYPIYRGTGTAVTSYLSVFDDSATVQLLVEIIDSADSAVLALNE